jgi:hypothetical protein
MIWHVHIIPISRMVDFCESVALFMFVWPYVRSHILCTQLVICLCWILFIFGILVGHDLSMRMSYRFHGWLIFARVIALFMFVWPYVRTHILCTQLVICLLSHFIHIWYIDWPWSEHAHSIPISWMVDFCECYSPFHVWPYVRPHILCTQLVICLCRILFIFGIMVGHDLAHIIPISRMVDLCESYTIALFMFVWPYVRWHILCTQLVICLLSHFIHIRYRDWPWTVHAHIIPISRMVDFCESYSPFHVPLRAAAINYFLN